MKQNFLYEVDYFGWLCSSIAEYDSTLSIPTTVVTKPGNERSEIFPHQNHDHPFVRDYYNGISAHEAQQRVDEMMRVVVGE